jgi:hypothetical protein
MKFIAIILYGIILSSFIIWNIYDIPHFNKAKDSIVYASPNSSHLSKKNEISSNFIENYTVSKTDNNKMKGLLIVKILVNNNVGNKTPFDFIINIHANDPSIASFHGNSSGTHVMLGMGMYSVSELPIPGYFSSYSTDCFGGIMAIDIKHCIITNTYSPPHSSISK